MLGVKPEVKVTNETEATSLDQEAIINPIAEQTINAVSVTLPELHQEPPTLVEETIQPFAGNVANMQQGEIAPMQQVALTGDDLDDFRKWQAGKRDRRITEKSKEFGNDVSSRRNTLVLRRVDCRVIAPDEDVLAYLLVYDMKEPSTPEGKKVQVSDIEIKAYLALDYEFTSPPTLEALNVKAKELGGSESDEQV